VGVEAHSGPVGLVNNPESGRGVIAPDQGFFDSLNGELTDKGFLVTSTEELFQWARTGSLWWMTFGYDDWWRDESFGWRRYDDWWRDESFGWRRRDWRGVDT